MPPKALFDSPRPSDLVTVPACSECNRRFEKEEEYIRGIFRLTQAGMSDTVRNLWPKLDRMLKRSPGLRTLIASSIKPVHMVTPEGIHIGQRLAIETDWARIATLIGKLVRGLYYFEFDSTLPLSTHIDVPAIYADHLNLMEFHSVTRRGKRSWPGTFEYKFNQVDGDPSETVWLFRFYTTHIFTAFTSKSMNPEEA